MPFAGPGSTLAELAALRSKYGVTRIRLEYSAQTLRPVSAYLFTDRLRSVGHGETEAEALDDAFARLVHRLGAELLKLHEGATS